MAGIVRVHIYPYLSQEPNVVGLTDPLDLRQNGRRVAQLTRKGGDTFECHEYDHGANGKVAASSVKILTIVPSFRLRSDRRYPRSCSPRPRPSLEGYADRSSL